MIVVGLRRAVRRVAGDWREIDVTKRQEAHELDSLGQHMSQCRRRSIVEI
jgi:hypothetical protein